MLLVLLLLMTASAVTAADGQWSTWGEWSDTCLTQGNRTRTRVCKDLSADIVLVIDASGSIGKDIFNNHTKRFVKAVMERFDIGATRTRIGVVVYALKVYYTLPLIKCPNVACLLSAIDELKYTGGGTCTGDGIAAATDMLRKPLPINGETRSRAIVVITDGIDGCTGAKGSPKRSNEARGLGIDVYAVAVGVTFTGKPSQITPMQPTAQQLAAWKMTAAQWAAKQAESAARAAANAKNPQYIAAAAKTAKRANDEMDAICGGDARKKFIAENYQALDMTFVEKLHRQLCSTSLKSTKFDRDGSIETEKC